MLLSLNLTSLYLQSKIFKIICNLKLLFYYLYLYYINIFSRHRFLCYFFAYNFYLLLVVIYTSFCHLHCIFLVGCYFPFWLGFLVFRALSLQNYFSIECGIWNLIFACNVFFVFIFLTNKTCRQ